MHYKNYKRILLIDLDGVLNEYSGNFNKDFIPPLKNGAREFLASFPKEDYEIKIFTTRNNLLSAKWLIENDLDNLVSDVTNFKEPAFLHIDDRCVCLNGNYKNTIEKIKKFNPYWKE